MTRTIEDINTSFGVPIDNMISQKAALEVKFHERLASIKQKISESPSLQHLDITKDIDIFADWTIQMMIVDTNIIKQQQKYVVALLDSADSQEFDEEESEAKLREMEDNAESLRQQRDTLKQDLITAKENFVRPPPVQESVQVALERPVEQTVDQPQEPEHQIEKLPVVPDAPDHMREMQKCNSCKKLKDIEKFKLKQKLLDSGIKVRDKACSDCLSEKSQTYVADLVKKSDTSEGETAVKDTKNFSPPEENEGEVEENR